MCVSVDPVYKKRRVSALQPLFAKVESCLGMPRHRQAQQVCHGAAAGQDAARFRRHAHHFLQPLQNLLLHQRGSLLPASQVGVNAGGEHVGQHCQGRAIAANPAPGARMAIAAGVGQHVAQELLVDALSGLRSRRKRLIQRSLNIGRHRLPGRLLAKSRHVIEHVVEHAVAKHPQTGPVFGIKCQLPDFGFGQHCHAEYGKTSLNLRCITLKKEATDSAENSGAFGSTKGVACYYT